MGTTLANGRRPVRPIWSPGVHFEDRVTVGDGTTELMSGVPAFLGFAGPMPIVSPDRQMSAVALDRWNADEFERLIRPAADSFLPMAVRGFFANGGRRCVVVGVPPGSGAEGFLAALQRGGPLEECHNIDLVCVPDAMAPMRNGGFPNNPYEIHNATLTHCEAMGDRFAILDAQNVGQNAAQSAVDDVLGKASLLRSGFGALYFPWIASDPTGDALGAVPPIGSHEWRSLSMTTVSSTRNTPIFGPPCGHVAGLFARIDALVGPQRSPANASLRDAIDTSVHLSDDEYAHLNDGGVNCLRSFGSRGIGVAGARTRSGHSAWTFVSTVRVILGFRRWLEVGMRDLVFEPQTMVLWDRIRVRLVSRCFELLRSGALAGDDPSQAFFVKCDHETNPPDVSELGQVVAHVGLAPSIPAEFIVVRIQQSSNGSTLSTLSESN